MPQAKTILEHPAVQRARLRAKCERAVDRLLAVLDLIDGDPDTEPSLGFSEPLPNPRAYGALDQAHIAEGATDDREGEHDGREPDTDAEDERMRGAEIINALLAHADCQSISADRVVATLTIPGKVLDDAFALVASVEDFEP